MARPDRRIRATGERERSREFVSTPHSLMERELCPDPTKPLPAIVVKGSLGSPLVFRKRIESIEPSARAGDLAVVYNEEHTLLGYGYFNPKAEIALRMIRWGQDLPDESFWEETLRQAVRLRNEVLRLGETTNAMRLIHAEGDGFPGLVLDQFDDTLSAEAFSYAMYVRAKPILERLRSRVGAKHVTLRPAPHTLSQEGFEAPTWISPDAPSRVVVHEYGTRFYVDIGEGHKTGFFCDQRENRKRLSDFCADQTVLDLCCYTGGFSIQAKKLGGAKDVIGVDLDEAPLKVARDNANLNQIRAKFIQADAFAYMRDMMTNHRQFGVVVLDPPKLIRSRAEIEEGTRKHYALNRLAMQLVAPGGMFLTCTCAGLLPSNEFQRLIMAAARHASSDDRATARRGREIQILARTGAAPDHPISGSCPQTEYLQAFWIRVL